MILKLFTQPTCGKCPAAKALVRQLKTQTCLPARQGCKIEEYDVTTVDGMAEASFYTVMATPTILICDDSGRIIKGFRGETPSEKELISLIVKDKDL